MISDKMPLGNLSSATNDGSFEMVWFNIYKEAVFTGYGGQSKLI